MISLSYQRLSILPSHFTNPYVIMLSLSTTHVLKWEPITIIDVCRSNRALAIGIIFTHLVVSQGRMRFGCFRFIKARVLSGLYVTLSTCSKFGIRYEFVHLLTLWWRPSWTWLKPLDEFCRNHKFWFVTGLITHARCNMFCVYVLSWKADLCQIL